MVQGTTPTFVLTVNGDVDLSVARNVYVTIAQNGKQFTLTGEQIAITGDDNNVVECYLPQEDAMRLTAGVAAKIQVNWTYLDVDGVTIRRAATKAKSFDVDEQLLRQVIS